MGRLSVLIGAILTLLPALAGAAGIVVVQPAEPSPQERLAAREVVRYLYLRTGELPKIVTGEIPSSDAAVVIARKDRPAQTAPLAEAAGALEPQQYLLKTFAEGGQKRVFIVGGDDAGVLYGAYRFAEKLGVRFYLHGDVVPDEKIPAALPDIDETARPIFDTRGINPFHDFPEGPDWWNRDDYLAYIHQLAKLRMNFIGLHCYPEGGVGPEPAVWIGPPADMDANGKVARAYPSQWANTARDKMWGYKAMPTGEFAGGAAQLFAQDVYGPEVQAGMMPSPATEEQSNELFERTGDMFAAAFAQARALGVKTCVGTETPLTIPKAVRERLAAQGKDPKDPAVAREVYTGIFQRIARRYPVDYYWLWTPEGWTWQGNKPEQFKATVDDIQAALDALKGMGDPFALATCGWVLGPVDDRAALDKALPKSVALSCINRQVGHAAVEPGFAAVSGRPKWAIPWMENDPNMIAPQPWVGRMRYDAADARRLGCTGLLGIHWRTKAMAHNVAALAAAAWEQPWVPADFEARVSKMAERPVGPSGGKTVHYNAAVENTDDDPVYQTVRFDVDAYSLKVPAGRYAVTLKFNEPAHGAEGKRVFGVKLQGKQVIPTLDIFAKAGKNKALDFTFDGVAVEGDRLNVEFTRQVEYPCIAGIEVKGLASDGSPFSRRINCGGDHYKDYEPDHVTGKFNAAERERALPAGDFYLDFARANFGPEAAEPIGQLFAAIDGTNLPEPCGWQAGPGGIKVNSEPWAEVAKRYAFVSELESLRSRVQGAGNLERFDYWLDTYRAMRAMAEAGCLRGRIDAAVAALKKEADAEKKMALAREALADRVALARVWERMVEAQVAAADTPGELGTLANIEQHNRKGLQFPTIQDAALEQAIGTKLPPESQPSRQWHGKPRITVPTVRTLAAPGEQLKIRVLIPTPTDVAGTPARAEGRLMWRPLTGGAFKAVPLRHVGRAVYEGALPLPAGGADAVEYYIEAQTTGGSEAAQPLHWPATAPALNQTVVIDPIGQG